MTSKEASQPLSHAAGILNLQQVRCVRNNERFDIGEPLQQQFVSLAPNRIELQTPRPYGGQHRLNDTTGVVPARTTTAAARAAPVGRTYPRRRPLVRTQPEEPGPAPRDSPV